MKFRAATLAAGSPIADAYRDGMGALDDKDRRLVRCRDAARITGSLALDAALEPLPRYANEPRWDYGLGHTEPGGTECAVWVEVHPALGGEVGQVLRKLKGLQDFLRSESCAALWQLTLGGAKERARYVWIASDAIRINRNSPQARQLAQSGLGWPVKSLLLP